MDQWQVIPPGKIRDKLILRVTGASTLAVGLAGLVVVFAQGGPDPGWPRFAALVIALSTLVVGPWFLRIRRISVTQMVGFAFYAEIGIGASCLLVQDRPLGQTLGVGLSVASSFAIFFLDSRRAVVLVMVNAALLAALAGLALQQDPADPAGALARFGVGLVLATVIPYFSKRYVDGVRADAASHYFLANHDPLTGLLNRRGFDAYLSTVAEAGAVASSAGVSEHDRMTVVVLDLDRFKAVNDQYGHGRGDQVLSVVGHRLRSQVGLAGVAARTGGEEFAVLMITDPAAASGFEPGSLADDLLRVIHREDDAVPVTASVGVAHTEGPLDVRRVQSLLESADRAMYRAKRAGGARVEVSV